LKVGINRAGIFSALFFKTINDTVKHFRIRKTTLRKTAMKKYLRLFILVCALVSVACNQAAGFSLKNSQDLAFGTFVAGSGGSVTVSLSGARSSSGGVLLLSLSGGTAAQFDILGPKNKSYAVTLPADGVVTITRTGGGSMAVNSFVSNISALNSGSDPALKVGATLAVGASQAVGNYSGTFTVTLVYN
jgi:type 1 fimbria pilin